MANRLAGATAPSAESDPLLAPRRTVPGSLTILGIDPGLERCGYAIVDVRANRVYEAGVVRSTIDRPLPERLYEIDSGLDSVLAGRRIDLVAVEDLYAHYKHPRTAILMGHARGVILLAAARRHIEVLSLPATQIKKAITGSGRAGKRQIQHAVMAALGLSKLPEPCDVADALAAALCAGMSRTSRIKHGE
ncbi:MAG: crossover junction endodeoxyribonuclease RuvC [Phycisphaerae bacterium]